MRRTYATAIVMILALVLAGGGAEARRRISIPKSTSTSSCVERDADGDCIRWSRSNSSGSDAEEESEGGGLITWLLVGAIVFGGGAFKLLRRGVGVAASTASSMARANLQKAEGTSDWAVKAASRMGGTIEPAADGAAAPAPAAPARSSGNRVASSPPVRRSAGFGKTADASPAAAPLSSAGSRVVQQARGSLQPRAGFGRR